jgi:hypothetical protein
MIPAIAALLQAAPAIGGGLAQLFGKNRRDKQEDASMRQMQSLAEMFKGDISGIEESQQAGFMNSPEAQSVIQQLKQQGVEGQRSIEAQSETNGLTDESKVAMMGKNKQAQATGMSSLMGHATNYKNMLFGQKQQAQRGLAGVTGSQYQAGMNNRKNYNDSLGNIFGNMQSGINAGFESGAFKIGK